MATKFSPPKEIKKYFRVRTEMTPGKTLRHRVECRTCGVVFRYPWKEWAIGTELKLLDHAYSHMKDST